MLHRLGLCLVYVGYLWDIRSVCLIILTQRRVVGSNIYYCQSIWLTFFLKTPLVHSLIYFFMIYPPREHHTNLISITISESASDEKLQVTRDDLTWIKIYASSPHVKITKYKIIDPKPLSAALMNAIQRLPSLRSPLPPCQFPTSDNCLSFGAQFAPSQHTLYLSHTGVAIRCRAFFLFLYSRRTMMLSSPHVLRLIFRRFFYALARKQHV